MYPELDKLHPSWVINDIKHPTDKYAAAKLRSLIGPEFSNSAIHVLAQKPGSLTRVLKNSGIAHMAATEVDPAIEAILKAMAQHAI